MRSLNVTAERTQNFVMYLKICVYLFNKDINRKFACIQKSKFYDSKQFL